MTKFNKTTFFLLTVSKFVYVSLLVSSIVMSIFLFLLLFLSCLSFYLSLSSCPSLPLFIVTSLKAVTNSVRAFPLNLVRGVKDVGEGVKEASDTVKVSESERDRQTDR